MALTTEQVLILNNLMYMNSDPLKAPDDLAGKTVGEWLGKIDVSQLNDSDPYGSFMTGSDWKNIIQAVQNDDTLMNMRIAETHVDSAGGGGRSAIFTSDATGDAVVVFKGTESSAEWSDNFLGGNVTDTPHQENALEWYQDAYGKNGLDRYEVTVTGHSKGGNKAKYIALLDGSVDHCVSFDGQGFSDEFMEKYAGQIASRQSVIENHNVDYDYVNLLLNDVGETTFYKGHDYGDGGFLENHCPNTFMNFDGDGNGNFTLTVNPDGQAPEMQALDAFLNNMLRSLPEDQQNNVLTMVNAIVDSAFSLDGKSGTEILNLFLQMAADPKYSDSLSYVAAYLIEYEQAHPEFADQINSVLEKFGMGEATQFIDIADSILNFSVDIPLIGTINFDTIASILASAAGNIPDWLLNLLSGWLEDKWGIKLTAEELRNLLNVIVGINEDMQSIKIKDNGGDITVAPVSNEYPSHSEVGTHGRTCVELQRMRTAAEKILGIANLLSQAGTDVEDLAGNLSFAQRLAATSELREKLRQSKSCIDLLVNRTREMGGALTEITRRYESTENRIVGFF